MGLSQNPYPRDFSNEFPGSKLPSGSPHPFCAALQSPPSAPALVRAYLHAACGCSVKQIEKISRKFKIWGAGREDKILVLENFKFPLRSIKIDSVKASVHPYYSEMSKPMLGGWCYLAHILVFSEEDFEIAFERRQILLLCLRVPPHFVHQI